MSTKAERAALWIVILIGIAHVVMTIRFFQPLFVTGTEGVQREPAVWWAAGGATVCLVGVLNLIRLRLGRTLPYGIRGVCMWATAGLLAVLVLLQVVNFGFLLLPRGVLTVALAFLLLSATSAYRRTSS